MKRKMASGALFGGQAGRTQSKNLVEFRAGKMFMKGKMVHPDKRKGTAYVYQSDDSLIHFCWKERSKPKPESQDDLIIFPDDAEFKAVSQCTTGRVFVLKFKNMSRKLFFWMQEPKSDKDEDLCRKVNESINNPPAPGSSRTGGGSGSGGLGGLPAELAAGLGGGSDLQSMLGNMSQQELMQLLGGMGVGGLGGLSSLMGGRGSSQAESAPPSRVQSSPGPRTTSTDSTPTSVPPRPVTAAVLPSQPSESGTTAATAATTRPPATGAATTPVAEGGSGGGSSKIQLSDLQNILSGMGGDQPPKEAVDLSKAVTPEAMIPILANAQIQERLLSFLPEGEKLPRTEGELRNTITSPQFQQAMSSFSAALASGQLGPLMAQFNLGEDVANAAAQGDVEAFAKAMQSSLDAKPKEESDDAEMKDDEEKE